MALSDERLREISRGWADRGYSSATWVMAVARQVAAEARDAALEEAALEVDGMPRSEEGYICLAAVDIAARIYALKSPEARDG